MVNRIPKPIAPLGVKAEEMALGADQYGASLPLVLNTAVKIREEKTQLSDSVVAYEQADRELTNRYATVRTASKAGRQWLLLAKETWKPRLGGIYNEGWDRTGLLNNLAVTRTDAGVQALLGSFKEFLANNADFESGTITAAQAATLLTALTTARGAVNTQATHVKNLKADRDAKAKALRMRLRLTIAELASRLGPLDPKWLSFGLNMPGAVPTPAAPLNVTVAVIGPNALAVQWERSTYASHYRVWAKVVGVDQELINVGDSTNLESTIQPLTAGTQVQVAVSAVSNGGESAKSEIVTVAIPN